MDTTGRSVIVELSVNQQACTVLYRDPDHYYNQVVLALPGDLSVDQLKLALQQLLQKHEVLTARCFQNHDSSFPSQLLSDGWIEFSVMEVADADLDQLIENANTRLGLPYDPFQDMPLRCCLLITTGGLHYLVMRIPALWSDAWTGVLLSRELQAYYQSQSPEPATDLIVHRNFSKWQHDLLQEPDEEGVAFWQSHHAQIHQTSIPFIPATTPGFKAGKKTIAVYAGELAQLQRQAAALGTDLHHWLLAIFARYLAQFSPEGVTIGYIPFKRNYRELDGTAGLVNKTLPLSCNPASWKNWPEAIRAVTQETEEVLAWNDYFHHNLDLSYCFEYLEVDAALSEASWPVVNLHTIVRPFNLKFSGQQFSDRLVLELYYNEQVNNHASLLVAQLQQCLQMLDDSSWQWKGISEMEQELLYNSNQAQPAPVAHETLITLFDAQVANNPEAIALEYEGTKISYGQLQERSKQLASFLKLHYQVGPGDLVGVMVDRSPWLLISLLGILRAGAAYVPMDIAYPAERVEAILRSSGAVLCICDQERQEKAASVAPIWVINEKEPGLVMGEEEYIADSRALAYVMYTSGSTGEPKGCMISHGNLAHYLQWADRYYPHEKGAGNTGLITTIAFDLTVTCLYLPLLRGKKLVIGSAGKEIAELLEYSFQHPDIDTLKLTPSHLSMLAGISIANTNIRCLIVGGEQLTWQQVQLVWDIEPAIRIFNEYGPTETTVGCVVKEIRPSAGNILIGKPVANTWLYVLDENQLPCPIGVLGELYIGGAGVGAGYWQQPALTAAAFVEDPFRSKERIYRTGDLVRWLPDADLEYAGRIDEQIKVRGYRIEPGEISKHLQEYPGIQTAVVLAKPVAAGGQELAAWLVSTAPIVVSAIRDYLAGRLPAYMIPDKWTQTDTIPLTANGKIDRKKLFSLRELPGTTNAAYTAPRNPTELKLSAIWAVIFGLERIGAKDNFFELGGHSLKATRLASQLFKEFGVRIRLKDLLANPVLEQQALLIGTAVASIERPILPVTQQASYVLSSGQRRLWILSQFTGSNIAYNIPAAYRFEGLLNRDTLAGFFSALIERHEILRTVFKEDGSTEIRQFVLPAAALAFTINYKDLRKDEDPEALAAIGLQQDFRVEFDLRAGPLFRVGLYQLADDQWIFSYVMHHIISDGWSMEIMLKELLSWFNTPLNEQPIPLPPLRIQYKDYAAWQQEQLSGELLEAHKTYWLTRLAGELPVHELPVDFPRPAIKSYRGAAVSGHLSEALTNRLQAYCRQQGATLFMGLLAAVNGLLYKYSGQQDIIIGSPVAGRTQAALDEQIGLYMNTLPLRTRFNATAGFAALLTAVKDSVLGAYDHQLYPFDELVDALQLQRDLSRHPLFDVMLVMQHKDSIHERWQQGLQGLQVTAYEQSTHVISKFDLLFAMVEKETGIEVQLEYNTDIFESATAERLLQHLETLLEAMVRLPDASLQSLSCVDAAEQQILLELGQGERHAYQSEATLAGLFREQVALRPAHTALVFEDRDFSYTDLDEQSNQLAHWLQERYSIGRTDLAAVQLDRSEWLVIALLAILKTGAAYVPIDPRYPAERIAYIQADTHCKVIINEQLLKAFQQEQASCSKEALTQVATADDLAYVIYTSGSTGQPKGCMLEHRGVINRLEWMWNHYGFTTEDIILQKTTFTFDVSVWELFLPLCFGAKMVLCTAEDTGSPERIAGLIHQQRITCLHFVPSILQLFVNYLSNDTNAHSGLDSMRLVITSGEALPASLADQWYALSSVPLHNLYGPTEASVDVSYYPTAKGDKRIPIGKPIWNTQLYILQEDGALCGRGIAGELCIGGVGVARGYLNKEELTAAKFTGISFNEADRIYRTGDQARWLSDGNIEYLGRRDEQVKLRGYRIELGEIESQLQQYPGIQANAVALKAGADGEQLLAAYLVSDTEWDAVALRNWLSQRLPVYMIPAYFLRLEQLPLSANGKISKQQLPQPDFHNHRPAGIYTAPRNETEEKLVQIWSEVLGIPAEKIGIHDDFFILGGHSLKALQVIARIDALFMVRINIQSIFKTPSIDHIAEQIHFLHHQDKQLSRKETLTEIDI